jgi:ribonucleoside-diphosphate reductase alpha chain
LEVAYKMTPERMQSLESGNFNMGRFFSQEGKDVYGFDIYGNPLNWISEDVSVTDDKGKTIFTQPNIQKPDTWSSLALKVVASKYFWGDQAKNEREDSIKKIISRVSEYMGRQGVEQGYFDGTKGNILKDELASICLNQLCVFNSPVWFNVGIQKYNSDAGGVSAFVWDKVSQKVIQSVKTMDRPQCSACFIQGMEDNMESIMSVQVAEANLFKAGSGTGSNRSVLRSSRETITGGGKASGPLSFMRGYDAYAGVIKSGGKTRRAAKMEILNMDHPDIIDFIEAKQTEEKKAWALIEQGYDGSFNGPAYGSVAFQNCNMSVRINDQFMNSVKENGKWQTKAVKDGSIIDTYDSKELMNKIAEGTHICGDPGIQNDSIINKYHTCKNSGTINASNPCSEYMFLDDTACNLASINLMKFRTAEGGFDVERFKQVVRHFITAMDIIIDGASYPTEKIAERSHVYRTLGLGYANLGALLMSLGLPYDSDEGRAVAAAITAVMCGEAYKTSAELAASVGPFAGYAQNREPMLEVMKMHREHVRDIDVEKIPSALKDLVNIAWDCWTDAVETGEKFGYRNAQTTVLAPTGTIAFMMDCDTTGIEPDIALVKYKVLAGGGMLKIVNKSVPLALRNLGYSETEVNKIIDFIDKNDTIEECPELKKEHLPIFDCAFVAAKGKRSVHYKGHINMMSVTQPFLSGAISKTVNMPEKSTVEEIADAYIYAWEQGLKAVAIYRENSKRSQPLNTQKTEGDMVKKAEIQVEKIIVGEREHMPQTRRSITHKFDINGNEGYLTVGLHDDGRPGELFLNMHKVGSTVNGLVDSWATLCSVSLQYGVPVDVLFSKFRHQRFEPSGFVRNVEGGDLDNGGIKIRTASSIVDYVAQFMLNTFGEGTGKVEFSVQQLEKPVDEQKGLAEFAKDEEGDFKVDKMLDKSQVCPICSAVGTMKQTGNCSKMCTDCNSSIRAGCGE